MKPYGTEQSLRSTLTNAELATIEGAGLSPFVLAAPDDDPLPAVTRQAVLVEGGRVRIVDPKTGEVAP